MSTSIAIVVALVALGPLVQTKAPPISVTNAGKVHPVAEFAKRVHKIVSGPGPGQLTFFDLNHSVEIVDDVTFRPLRVLAEQSAPGDFAASNDGRYATWQAGGGPVYVIQSLADSKAIEINLGKKMAGFASFSPDSKLVAIGDTFWEPNAEGEGHSEMKLFDLSGKLIRTLESPGPGVMTPVFSPDGKILAVGNRNHETRLFEVATGKLLHTLPRRMTHQIAFSPDGKVLAAGYVDGVVALWDVATGSMLRSKSNVAEEIATLDWSPQGDVLVTGGRESKIILWDASKLVPLTKLDCPKWVVSVRFTKDGTRLLSSGGKDFGRTDRKVVVWAVSNDVDK